MTSTDRNTFIIGTWLDSGSSITNRNSPNFETTRFQFSPSRRLANLQSTEQIVGREQTEVFYAQIRWSRDLVPHSYELLIGEVSPHPVFLLFALTGKHDKPFLRMLREVDSQTPHTILWLNLLLQFLCWNAKFRRGSFFLHVTRNLDRFTPSLPLPLSSILASLSSRCIVRISHTD